MSLIILYFFPSSLLWKASTTDRGWLQSEGQPRSKKGRFVRQAQLSSSPCGIDYLLSGIQSNSNLWPCLVFQFQRKGRPNAPTVSYDRPATFSNALVFPQKEVFIIPHQNTVSNVYVHVYSVADAVVWIVSILTPLFTMPVLLSCRPKPKTSEPIKRDGPKVGVVLIVLLPCHCAAG